MKPIRCAALAGLLVVTAVPAHAGELLGRYRGCIESGDEMTAVETQFEKGKNGVTGRYTFLEPDGALTSGRLDADGVDDRGRQKFIWRDKYGKGRAAFEVDADGTAFNGTWISDGGDTEHIWWGRKSLSATLDRIDCGQRSDT